MTKDVMADGAKVSASTDSGGGRSEATSGTKEPVDTEKEQMNAWLRGSHRRADMSGLFLARRRPNAED